MSKYKILDLFCGAGGCSMGYKLAGFDVVGVDKKPQPNYPFTFHQADALQFPLSGFDAIHASPPCQHYTQLRKLGGANKVHPDLVAPIRARLIASGKPFVIENVLGAPLLNPVMLCGTMFNLRVIRHRLFECHPFFVWPPASCDHSGELYTVLTKSCRVSGDMRGKSSHATGKAAMKIDWMTQFELGESIPPAFTKYIGEELIAFLNMEAEPTSHNTGSTQAGVPASAHA